MPQLLCYILSWASSWALVVKNPPARAGGVRDSGSIPGLERSPGGGNGNRLQYSSWKTPWTEEPGGLQSTGLQKTDTTYKPNNNNKISIFRMNKAQNSSIKTCFFYNLHYVQLLT